MRSYSFRYVVRLTAIATWAIIASCNEVTPPDPSVASVSIEPNNMTLLVGQKRQVIAATKDAQDRILDGRALSWSTSDSTKATVSDSGLVTAVAPGTATITASSEGKTGTATVTVSPVPVSTVAVDPPNAALYIGQTLQLSAVSRDSAGGILTERPVTWSSSDTTKAKITYDGLVTAVAAGSATITAAVEGKTGTAIVSVSEPLTDIAIDFCANHIPLFFAYRNDGGAWTRVVGDASGKFAFNSTRVLSLAIIFYSINSDYLNRPPVQIFESSYLFGTVDDITPMLTGCVEATKDISLTFSNVTAGSKVVASLGTQYLWSAYPTRTYTLRGLAAGPLDLIAHTEVDNAGAPNVIPDRILIRRRQDFVTGSTVNIDMGSAEAQQPALHTLTVTEPVEYRHTFRTSTTPVHWLSRSSPLPLVSDTATLFGVPAGLTEDGDLHILEALAGTWTRTELQYHRLPGNRTVSFGPELASPITSVLSTDPLVLLTTQLPWQTEYNSFVVVNYTQGDPNPDPDTRSIKVIQTIGYKRAAGTAWEIAIPDLQNVPGFPTEASLVRGKDVTSIVNAYGGSFAAYLGAPRDGTFLRRALAVGHITPP